MGNITNQLYSMEFIQEQYVTFETAKLLYDHSFEWRHFSWGMKRNSDGEEYGFPEREDILGSAIPPFFNTCYNDEGKAITPKHYNPKNKHYPRPTQAMTMEWILKKYEKFIQIEYAWELIDGEKSKSLYFPRIIDIKVGGGEKIFDYKSEPYEAIEVGILYILQAK